MAMTEASSNLLGLPGPVSTFAMVGAVVFTSVVLTIAYYGALFIYNIWLHPLSKYPGPRLAAASPLWMVSSYFFGRTPTDLEKLHEQYGPVVRTGPNELSYINPIQWREIYGHKPQDQPEFAKDPKYFSGLKGEPVILTADKDYHGYIRKLLAPGFSDKSLREQEPVLQEYIDTLFRRLHEECGNGERPIDIVGWYNYLLFDFIGYLTFGESFNCLTTGTLHTWVGIFFSLVKSLSYHQMSARFPWFLRPIFERLFIPKKVVEDLKTLKALNEEKISYRLKNHPPVPDFMDKLVEAFNSGKMSPQQLEGNAQILIAAGSETTATLLSGLTWLLLQNPGVLAKLTDEVRGRFGSAAAITLAGTSECRYLQGCVEEALRVYPPSPQPHHRIVPAGGAVVNGEALPAGTSVAVPVYAAARSPLSWAEPAAFAPERWTGEEPARFARDRREASRPFSLGPRACVGRGLAYAEIRLVLARLVWHFDLASATPGDWLDQRVFVVWEKAPLYVKLRPRRLETPVAAGEGIGA
ncbi:putative averantin oxidoreductase [Rosellinia necatrix]|uniref:Putative averantin oxidoreductase n=1 Tax=Rosellinia necatrix TaxID=77044 RepID=A0A1S7UNS0_ROSNE|nr:putative averantin oxidoreductase [Rosellinia necatrix]